MPAFMPDFIPNFKPDFMPDFKPNFMPDFMPDFMPYGYDCLVYFNVNITEVRKRKTIWVCYFSVTKLCLFSLASLEISTYYRDSHMSKSQKLLTSCKLQNFRFIRL